MLATTEEKNMLPKTYHVPTQCFLYPDIQHVALLFTGATDTGKVLSTVNAINTRKFPLLLLLTALQVWRRPPSELQWLIPD